MLTYALFHLIGSVNTEEDQQQEKSQWRCEMCAYVVYQLPDQATPYRGSFVPFNLFAHCEHKGSQKADVFPLVGSLLGNREKTVAKNVKRYSDLTQWCWEKGDHGAHDAVNPSLQLPFYHGAFYL